MKKLILLRKYGMLILVFMLICASCAPKPEHDLDDAVQNTNVFTPVRDVSPDGISGLELSAMTWISFPFYQCIASLVDSSSAVVVGEIIDCSIPRILIWGSQYDQNYELFTISELKINRVIKGEARAGDIVRLRQPGGVYGDFHNQVFPAFDFFYTGQYGVFFIYFHTEKCTSAHTHLFQGFVEIVDGAIKNNHPASLFENGMPEEELIELLLKKM